MRPLGCHAAALSYSNNHEVVGLWNTTSTAKRQYSTPCSQSRPEGAKEALMSGLAFDTALVDASELNAVSRCVWSGVKGRDSGWLESKTSRLA